MWVTLRTLLKVKMEITTANHRTSSGWIQRGLLVSMIFFMLALVASSADAEKEEEVFQPDGEEVFEPEGEEVFEPDDDDPPAEGVGGVSRFSIGQADPPPGYQAIEVVDRTIGFRDDAFAGISHDANGNLWVTTYEGRAYRSQDSGENWHEYNVLPDVKELFGFSGQRVLLGSLRKPVVPVTEHFLLGPVGHIAADRRSLNMLSGNLNAANAADGTTESGFALDSIPSLGGFTNNLADFADRAGGSTGIVLGAGLSNRAPRLSLLLDVLKRPTANISMQRLLYTTAVRYTAVREVTAHPTDPKRVFAATGFGLYQSIDTGMSWFRAFAGMTPAERWIGHVVADPKNPKRVYMGTSRGLFVSDDSGDSWTKNTKVPEISIRRVAIDPVDSRYVYVGGFGGVYRSSDYGENFDFAFYHSIPRRRDILWISIDPFDPNVAYLGTGDGLMRTNKFRTATVSDWEVVSGLRTVNLVISVVQMCSKHPGHLYIQTRADLPTINYTANGPESLILESWDHGTTWRELVGNQTGGDVQWFTLDAFDPDTVWVAFSRAIVQIKRVADPPPPTDLSKPLSMGRPVLPDMPSMGQVIRAALKYTELELADFVTRLDSLRNRNWLPKRLHITGAFYKWNVGAELQDIQWPGFRYVNVQNHDSWNVTAWMSWALPDLFYRQDSAPLMRFQELKMVNGVRDRILYTIHRNYGELQRIAARLRYEENMSLSTRINLALRTDYLEAIIDLSTGNYLSKWKKEATK